MIVRGFALLLSLMLSSVAIAGSQMSITNNAGSLRASPESPFVDGKTYDLSKIFDYQALEELDREAENLWSQMVREAGSQKAALVKMYQTSRPDPRLVQLHENVLQLIASSQINDIKIYEYYDQQPSFDYAYKVGHHMHPLLREVVSNVRSFLTKRVGEILSSSRVSGFFFKRYEGEVNGELQNCTFYGACFNANKYKPSDFVTYKAWVYADIIHGFDLAYWNCDRFLNPTGAHQDLVYANTDFIHDRDNLAPRSRRGILELSMLTHSCKAKDPTPIPGTAESRGQMYLKNTRLLE